MQECCETPDLQALGKSFIDRLFESREQKSSIHWLTPQMAPTEGLGTPPRSPGGWQEHLGHLWLLFQAISRQLDWKPSRQDSSRAHKYGMLVRHVPASAAGPLCAL